MADSINRRDVLKMSAAALAVGAAATATAKADDAPPAKPKRPLQKAYFGLPSGGGSLTVLAFRGTGDCCGSIGSCGGGCFAVIGFRGSGDGIGRVGLRSGFLGVFVLSDCGEFTVIGSCGDDGFAVLAAVCGFDLARWRG